MATQVNGLTLKPGLRFGIISTAPSAVELLVVAGGGGGGNGGSGGAGYAGGSGVVIIRYPENFGEASSISGTYSVIITGGYRYYRFTGSGTIRFS